MRSKPKKQKPAPDEQADDNTRRIIHQITENDLVYVGGTRVRDGQLLPLED